MVFYRSCCYVMLACNTPCTGVDNVYVVGVVRVHRRGLMLQCSPTWFLCSSVHRRGTLVFTDVVSCSSVRFGVDWSSARILLICSFRYPGPPVLRSSIISGSPSSFLRQLFTVHLRTWTWWSMLVNYVLVCWWMCSDLRNDTHTTPHVMSCHCHLCSCQYSYARL